MRILFYSLLAAPLVGCATVHPEDTEAWVGQPISVLEKQPLFLTMQVVKTQASDGTDIWNYVTGQAATSCTQDGTLLGRRIRLGNLYELHRLHVAGSSLQQHLLHQRWPRAARRCHGERRCPVLDGQAISAQLQRAYLHWVAPRVESSDDPIHYRSVSDFIPPYPPALPRSRRPGSASWRRAGT